MGTLAAIGAMIGSGGVAAAAAVWENPYPEIVAASSSYTDGRDTSYVSTAAIGNAFALAVANKWLIYKRVAGPFGELYDCIPAPAYQTTAFAAQQAAAAMPGSPVFDTLAADYFYYPAKFKNRASGEIAPDLNMLGCSRPTWIAPEMLQRTNCTRTDGVLGADGSTSKAISLTTSGTAEALLYIPMPLGRWTLAMDMKADASCNVDIGVSIFSNSTKALTTSWQTVTVTKELTSVSSNNNFIYLMRNGASGRVISIDNIRLIPGGAAGSVSAFNRNGALIGSGSVYGDINQSGLMAENRSDISSARRGIFVIPECDTVGAAHSAMSMCAAINMVGAHASLAIEAILSAFPESGSDYQSVFFAGNNAGTPADSWSAGGSTQNGTTSAGVSLYAAGWIVVTVICSASGSELWFNDLKVASKSTSWSGSTHRALQVFMSGSSSLKSLNAELCSLTIWNSAISASDRAAAYAEATARIAAHGATFTKASTFMVVDGDSITAGGNNTWASTVPRLAHYTKALQSYNQALANARLGAATDTTATNSLWGRLVTLRTKISEAIDAGYTVIACIHIGANDTVDTMLADYQDGTDGIAAYYDALTATTHSGVTYSDPSKIKLIGGTVLPQKLVAQGGTFTATQETQRDSTNAYILTLTANVDAFADQDLAFGGVWSAGNYNDGVHPNTTGQNLMRDAADAQVYALWTA